MYILGHTHYFTISKKTEIKFKYSEKATQFEKTLAMSFSFDQLVTKSQILNTKFRGLLYSVASSLFYRDNNLKVNTRILFLVFDF